MNYPDTITFEADGKDHDAVVGLPLTKSPGRDAMTRTVDGVTYQLFISLGSIPGYPGIGFIARPVEDGPNDFYGW